MSHIHLKIYNNDDNVNQCYRISPRRKNNNFNINDYVKNNNNLYGIIKDKNDNYIIVNWNDNTYERLQIPLINKNYLIRISKNEYSDNINYVDTIESQISPLQTSTVNTASSQDNFIENDFTNNQSTENEQVMEKNTVKISKKELSAENNKITQLINLALNKGIIDPDEVETEKLKLTAFDDAALKQYEEMLNNTSDEGEVISLSESQIDTSGLSPQEAEAQNMLHKLKHQRGISTMSRQRNINVNDVNSRSLHDMEKTAITYMNTNNGQTINNSQVSLDDSLLQALSNNNYQSNNYQSDNYSNSNNYQNNNNYQNDSYQDNNDISNNNSFDIDNIDSNSNINFNNTFDKNFNSDYNNNHNNYGNNSNSNINNNVNNANVMSLDSIVEQIQRDNKSSFLKTPFNGLTKPLLINTSDNINPINNAFRELFSPDMFTHMGKR